MSRLLQKKELVPYTIKSYGVTKIKNEDESGVQLWTIFSRLEIRKSASESASDNQENNEYGSIRRHQGLDLL